MVIIGKRNDKARQAGRYGFCQTSAMFVFYDKFEGYVVYMYERVLPASSQETNKKVS